ncbi:MAG TPA: patatin-like phospholipase family protein [Ottowia sp.]|uniref:patatin-like phospholipase family protein n=1 Tax=Ottowia sp. TaxID=1898956 RepID=UPI002C1A3366|nr:patatin-like phospholipase family protein [Ottowia sp.]HMN21028.1 patatin-like phospholipase family protein [Ottowia sp.]
MAIDGKTLGLALSGGGYRATLFGLGSLWRLSDAGLLGRLDRITSVSGGSILAGILAHGWPRLQFTDGRANNFVEVVVEPTRRFCGQTIDIGAGLAGLLTPFKTAGDFLADRYAKDLFGDTTLKQLPTAASGAPFFTYYATNLQTGRSFRFRQDMVADYMLGVSSTIDVPLAFAVAASSAFPPLFSPIILKTDPAAWREGDAPASQIDALRRRIVLADGGIYDNMGLESLLNGVDIVLVSDAGAPFELQESPHEDNVLQLGRVRDILIDQTRALRKRWLVGEFVAGRKRGAYWGIGTRIGAYGSAGMTQDTSVSDALEHVPTRLKALDPRRQGQLINWGYALCDIALRTRAGLPLAMATSRPVPEAAL